jgi:hypothetical protein
MTGGDSPEGSAALRRVTACLEHGVRWSESATRNRPRKMLLDQRLLRDTADDRPTSIWPHSDQRGREIFQAAVDDGRDLSVTPINHLTHTFQQRDGHRKVGQIDRYLTDLDLENRSPRRAPYHPPTPHTSPPIRPASTAAVRMTWRRISCSRRSSTSTSA